MTTVKTYVLTQDLQEQEALEALEQILTEQRSRWLALIMRHEQNKALAEELLSSATLKLMVRAQSGFEEGLNLSAYVHTTIMNVLRTHAMHEIERRADGPQYQHEMSSVSDEDTDPLDNVEDGCSYARPEQATARREAITLLDRALSKIEVKQPQAVKVWRMYCLEEQPAEDIAQQTGLTPGAVSKQVFNVNQALRKSPDARHAFEALAA